MKREVVIIWCTSMLPWFEVRSSRCWGPMLSGESIAKVERRYSRAFNLLPREVVVRVADLQPAQIPLTVL